MNSFQKKWIKINTKEERIFSTLYLLLHIFVCSSILFLTNLNFVFKDNIIICVLCSALILISIFYVIFSFFVISVVWEESLSISHFSLDCLRKNYQTSRPYIAFMNGYKIHWVFKIVYGTGFVCLLNSFYAVLGMGIYFSTLTFCNFLIKCFCRKFVRTHVNPISVAVVEQISYDDHGEYI